MPEMATQSVRVDARGRARCAVSGAAGAAAQAGSGAWWGGEEASKRTSGYLARALAMIFFEMSTPITVPVVAPWIKV